MEIDCVESLRVSHSLIPVNFCPVPGSLCSPTIASIRMQLHAYADSWCVQASRPGDTILVEPGAWHEARDVAVRWPLRIVGGGAAPADTVLHCPRGADAALDVRWT